MAGLIAGLGAFLGGAFAVRKAEQEIDDLVSDKNEAKATRKAESVGRQLEDTNAKLRVKHEVERERRDQRRLDMRYKHGLDTHASSSSSSSSSHGRAQRGSSNDAGASVPNTVEFEVSGVFGKSQHNVMRATAARSA
ncbi:hypothetical protein PTSG_00690 [Salpingoeca rosetta]|uniref:Uncharacterized protein n=1 Tax=Salpingoeca rosetta (strain ATCC 50818 / BSB-021) TaxID=946362 RepID=F2TX73_SALR5|nr:uncharacterized protein PTSG_00690 [Salpingoeca rosetta]EGD75982.1 hypothetical protein PTSG_00690 [Salpingoeca rosetta]|eukprot:XP_004998157.1 hypothetical protein PTSG_00690 [Salpingoeca rosetta]